MTIQNNINHDLQHKLWDAAARGDSAILRALAFEKGVDFRARDDKNRTPFNLATQYGHHDAATTILAVIRMHFERNLGIDRIAEEERKKRTWSNLFRFKNG